MKIEKFLLAAVAAGLLLLFGPGRAVADLYVEIEMVNTGMPMYPDGVSLCKHYFSADAIATDTGAYITIVDFKARRMYELDKASKTYRQHELKKAEPPKAPAGKANKSKKDLETEFLNQMHARSVAERLRVEPTETVKPISGYKCRKYYVTIMEIEWEYWVTQAFKGYDELKAVGAKAAQTFADNPNLRPIDFVGMIQELDGVPVSTESMWMGRTAHGTLKKVEQTTLDPNYFIVPADYAPARQ